MSGHLTYESGFDPLIRYSLQLDAERARHAIQQLPFHLKEIIVLRECCELSCQEIADILELPPDTVIHCLARARSRLHQLLSTGGSA